MSCNDLVISHRRESDEYVNKMEKCACVSELVRYVFAPLDCFMCFAVLVQ